MVRVNGIHLNMNLPDESEFEMLPVTEKKYLPHVGGVYFLHFGDGGSNGHNIAYIGEAKDIHTRCNGHKMIDNEIFAISWLPLSPYAVLERKALEQLYIMAYEPPYNIKGRGWR